MYLEIVHVPRQIACSWQKKIDGIVVTDVEIRMVTDTVEAAPQNLPLSKIFSQQVHQYFHLHIYR